MTTYCCFLPDLTGFMGSCCAGSNCQRQSLKAATKTQHLKCEFSRAIADFKVKDPATSPPSTAFYIIRPLSLNCNHFFLKTLKKVQPYIFLPRNCLKYARNILLDSISNIPLSTST